MEQQGPNELRISKKAGKKCPEFCGSFVVELSGTITTKRGIIMTTRTIAHPKVVSQPNGGRPGRDCSPRRRSHRARDALNAARRRLPMVQIDKDYSFEGPDGKASLLDLFDGRRQLVVYHFMFAPAPLGRGLRRAAPACRGRNIGHLRTSTRATQLSRSFRALRWPSSRPIRRARAGPSLVLLVRQRLQLRLPRHAGRSRRPGPS